MNSCVIKGGNETLKESTRYQDGYFCLDCWQRKRQRRDANRRQNRDLNAQDSSMDFQLMEYMNLLRKAGT